MKILIATAALIVSVQAHANDSCEKIISQAVQGSFPSQEEYSVSGKPVLVLETDPQTGMELFNTWKVTALADGGTFEITVVTRRRPGSSLADGCAVVGIY